MTVKEVRGSFRNVERDAFGFMTVAVGGRNGCGKDSAVRPEIATGAPECFGVESKTFRLNRKLQPLCSGRIQQVSLQGCDVYFPGSCVVSVLGELSLLYKEVSESASVVCGWVNPFRGGYVAPLGFLGKNRTAS